MNSFGGHHTRMPEGSSIATLFVNPSSMHPSSIYQLHPPFRQPFFHQSSFHQSHIIHHSISPPPYHQSIEHYRAIVHLPSICYQFSPRPFRNFLKRSIIIPSIFLPIVSFCHYPFHDLRRQPSHQQSLTTQDLYCLYYQHIVSTNNFDFSPSLYSKLQYPTIYVSLIKHDINCLSSKAASLWSIVLKLPIVVRTFNISERWGSSSACGMIRL